MARQRNGISADLAHPGGANLLFVDGAARFVSNDVDRGLWHVMHSRETPAAESQSSFVRCRGRGIDRRLSRRDVTWHEAPEFCRRLAEASEKKAEHRRYRLPTEAEWEYACRSGTSEPHRWTRQREADDKSGEAAGIEPALPVTKVGSYPANKFGLYDMRGNVWEWCADWFDRGYYSRSPVADPQGPAQG